MRRFFIATGDTFKSIFTDIGVLLIMILAPMIYGLYYPLPYSNEIIRDLPIAVVDHAQDSLSRKMIRMAEASPRVNVEIVANEHQAQQLLLQNEVVGLMIIPSDLNRKVTLGRAATVNIIGNGGYVLASKNAQQAMAEVVLTISAGVEIRRLESLGLGNEKISAIRNPVPLQIQPLYNLNQGYGSYVVPAVAWLILQQTLFMGCAMLVSTWMEKDRAYATPATWSGRLFAISLIHYLICLVYTGVIFNFWGYKTGENALGNLVLIGLFSPCVASIGCLLGLLIKDRERAMQVLVFSALPIYFVSGFSWPTYLLPKFLQYMRWIFPSTSAIHAGVNLNQIGGCFFDNRYYLIALALIAWIGISMLFWFGRTTECK